MIFINYPSRRYKLFYKNIFLNLYNNTYAFVRYKLILILGNYWIMK